MNNRWVLAMALATVTTITHATDRHRAFQALCDQAEARHFSRNIQPSGAYSKLESALRTSSDPQVIRSLVDPGTIDRPVNERGLTALAIAVISHNWFAAKTLLDLGADINLAGRDGATPIEWAILEQDYGMVCALVARGAKVPRQEGHEYLLAAASSTDLTDDFSAATTTVAFLLDEGFAVDARYAGVGESALMAAAGRGNIELIQELLARGADPLQTNGHGETPSMIATKEHQHAAARLLQEAEARSRIKPRQ